MVRHMVNYHLDLCQAHAVPHTVRAANLGKWFPPWTVSREMWREALLPHVSGVSTDILLFYVIQCCIYVGGLLQAGCWISPGVCVVLFWQLMGRQGLLVFHCLLCLC